MDGNPVEGEPSNPENNVSSFAEVLYQLCPQYMMMGMTYDEFWNRNTTCHKAYREAYKLRIQQEEWARWRQGAYIYDVLLRVAPVLRPFAKGKVEPGKYPEEPYPLTEKEVKEREEAREKANYEAYIARMEAASERELKRRAEEAAKEAKDCAEH